MDAQYTGSRISEKRKQLGLTQRELAERLHVTDKAVSKWERGVNFPDLGLMENLANALDTTPASLLGLENADQNEMLSSITELSNEQLEEARQDIGKLGWGSVVTAVLLALAYHLTQKRAVEVYYLLHTLITVIGIAGFGYLFKYGEIKKWEPAELGSFLGALFPILIWQGYQFLTGYSLHPVLSWVLIGAAVMFAQLHFLQVMKPKFMQLLPLILSLLFLLWQIILGGVRISEMLPLVCSLSVWLFDRHKHPQKWHMNGKVLGIGICLVLILALVICLLCYPSLVKAYVAANQAKLQAYAENLMKTSQYDTYWLWNVTAYPELGIVAFQTGGSGLAPGSIYEGFYYSSTASHIPFPGFEGSKEFFGNEAWFRDSAENSDNWQKSTQIAPNWYWFELHY